MLDRQLVEHAPAQLIEDAVELGLTFDLAPGEAEVELHHRAPAQALEELVQLGPGVRLAGGEVALQGLDRGQPLLLAGAASRMWRSSRPRSDVA